MACNTPFRLYKVTTFAGGHQVPLVVSWPARLTARRDLVRAQYAHVTDVLPTLVDLLGLTMPTERAGLPAEPFAGASFVSTLDDPEAPSTHRDQHYECVGNRAFYRDGWEVVTFRRPRVPFRDERWQLFHLAEDPTQVHDLADDQPERVAALTSAWEEAAWANQVFPLHEGTGIKEWLRPAHEAALALPVRIVRGTPTLERYRSSMLIAGRSFRVVIEWAYARGNQGVLVAHGGQEAGYVLYVEDDTLHLVHNAYGRTRSTPPVPLPASSEEVVLDVAAPGGGRWDIGLEVDGEHAGEATGFVQLARFLPFEGIDVGIDRRSPVSWDLWTRHGCFPFTGDLSAVTYQPGELAPDAPSRLLEAALEIGLALD
jgi:arylsulfatase